MAFEGFLTSIYATGDVTRPTFFELVAQEQLMDALRPAVRFLVSVFADRASPRVLLLLARWETVYTGLLALLEWYHLRTHGASFAEHFYGLARQEAAPRRKLTALEKVELQRRREGAPNLTPRQRFVSLFAIVLLPLLRLRCEERFREAEGVPHRLQSLRHRIWLRVYPWVHITGHALAMWYRMTYLLEQTDLWSPTLHVLGLQLVRRFPEPPAPDADEKKSRLLRLWEAATTAGGMSLWGGIYAMQFMQWWYQREHLLQPYQPKQVPPPPPRRSPYQDVALPPPSTDQPSDTAAGSRLVLLPEDKTVCPLCHRTRHNPALSCSGYVFCYTCLVPHVQRHGHCPVTGLAMTVEEVRRVRGDADDGL